MEQQELPRYMRAIFDESTDSSGPHLSTAELISYQKGGLDGIQYTQAQAHLVACVQCINAFRDVNDFFAPARDEEADTHEFEVRRQWHNFKQRFPVSNRFVKDEPISSAKSRNLLLAAAATVLVVMGAASLWLFKYRMENELLAKRGQSEQENLQASIGRLQDENRKLGERLQVSETQVNDLRKQLDEGQKQSFPASSSPAQILINPQSMELSPDSVLKSAGRNTVNKLVRSSSAHSFHLILTVYSLDVDDYNDYALEIFDQSGRLIGQRINGLAPDPARFNRFTIVVSRDLLKGGDYKLRLLGQTGPAWQKIAEYSLTVAR